MIDIPPVALQQEIAFAAPSALPGPRIKPVKSGAPAAPQIQCQVRLPRWCIVKFDGNVQSVQNGRYRTWRVLDRLYMTDGPLLIIEDTGCSGRGDKSDPRKVAQATLKGADGRSYESIKFNISLKERCNLEFRLPMNANAVNPIYKQMLLYGIFICNDDSCPSQLYRYSER